ncbi:CRISPR-associated helicase Cas3' [Cloacibacillus evryensis]|uniref:CRISPR-associated helicase Cas3' n=1 Tax=Cloacibacillus evryensis TaxID=508460 RepID=UPI0022E59609|nr:CRISPR-associated helicase Cas3' [Cloacibacillus evryensis]
MSLPDAWTRLLLGSLSGELESHPGRKLTDHLLESANLAEALLKKHGLELFLDVVMLAVLTHDCAKAKQFFQQHLYGGKGTEHAAPSSFFALPLNEELSVNDLFIMAEAVRRHHTCLQNWDDIADAWRSSNHAEQLAEMKDLVPDWPWSDVDSIIARIKEFLRGNDPYEDEIEDKELFADCWFRLRTVLSLLVAADRMNAIGLDETLFRALPAFKEKVFAIRGKIDEWRGDVARQCFENILKLIIAPGIYTLTLPTGAGKTNIGLCCAHMIAKHLGYETIIYVLPFISVVEQNADFAREVFGKEYVQEDHSLALAFSKTEKGKNGDNPPPLSKELWQRLTTLFRYWNSPIIATTMVQLWDAIYNPKALASIDFHRLSHAVVILDEPQGIDCRHWHEFGETLSYISKKFGTVFILMTATQPQIAEAQELAPPVAFPFVRHRYKFLDGSYKLTDLPNILRENCAGFAEKSGMAVFNTRDSALKAYRILKPLLGDNTYMLSGWMTSNHKRQVLKAVGEHLKKGELCHLIATQTVEAGVDLDFDWVFRDIGPLDSIIQAAGRCNRSALREKGLVLVAELVSDTASLNKSYASMVYDPVILGTTKDFLREHGAFEDNEVGTLVKEYYNILKPKLCPNGLWKNIWNGHWGDFIPLFADNKSEATLYIDDGEVDILLSKLHNLQPSLENREEIKWLRTKLAQYSIGVNPKLLTEWIEAEVCVITSGCAKIERWGDDEFFIVRSNGIGDSDSSIYHTTVGFQPQCDLDENDSF